MANTNRPVFFFDIDNCLYSSSTNIQKHMGDLIDDYFQKHLELSREDSIALHTKYYKEYGLALEGLVRYHKVDPLEFNSQVDDALPLDDILKPNPELQRLLSEIDTSNLKLWLFTNAYVNHGKRVVKLLGVDKFFEGITYCDYATAQADGRLTAKPRKEMYEKAMREAGAGDWKDCYFVDDSFMNVKAAAELGWTAVHIVESSEGIPSKKAAQHQIKSLQELKTIFPQFFKDSLS